MNQEIKEPIPRFKVVVSGPTGVGKTLLLRRYLDGHFDDEYRSTIGVDFRTKNMTYDGKVYNM
jgi:GTPase SAR1 family protein